MNLGEWGGDTDRSVRLNLPVMSNGSLCDIRHACVWAYWYGFFFLCSFPRYLDVFFLISNISSPLKFCAASLAS